MSARERPWYKWYAEGVDPHFQPVPQTVNDRMTRAFAEFSDIVMIEYYGKEYTYAQMHGLVSQAARALKAAGIGKGDRVALHLPNCPWHPIFFFGTLWAGATVTHLSPLDATREIEHKLKDSGAKLVISLTTPEFAGRFPALLAEGSCPIRCRRRGAIVRSCRAPTASRNCLPDTARSPWKRPKRRPRILHFCNILVARRAFRRRQY